DLAVITAFELNASCPNTSAGGLEFGATPEGVRELVRRCRGATPKPITVKLSPVVPDLTALAQVARDEGADAVTLVNTIPGALDHRLGNGSGGVSGPALLPIGVLATRRVTARVGMPVIGVGGIRTARDVREYLAAGAGEGARRVGRRMAQVHTPGGAAVVGGARAAAGDVALLGVTVLTSHDAGDFERVVGRGVPDLGFEAERLARLALDAGLAGVVASGHELGLLRETLGPGPLIVVPGIRAPGDAAEDQARTISAVDAVRRGATHLVVGRPITRAADPA